MNLRDACSRADRALRLGSTQYVIDLCEHLLRSFPGDLTTRSLLGHAALEQGQVDRAIQQFELILELDPENVDAYVASGIAHATAGRLNAALTAFERAYELDPGHQLAGESLSQLYAQRDGQATTPPAAPAVAVIRWQLRHANLDNALDAASRFLVNHPGDLRILLARAEALWRDGRRDEAERACRQMLSRYPRLLKPRLILGQILSGDRSREADGVEILHAAFADDPGGVVARRLFAGTSFTPPLLGDEIVVTLPDRLRVGPPEIAAALDVLPPPFADAVEDEWRPPEIIGAPASQDGSLEPNARPTTEEAINGHRLEGVETFRPTPLETLLLISCRAPLAGRYGLDGIQRLERRLQTLAKELESLGTRLIAAFVDDPGSMARFELPAATPDDPAEIKRAIDEITRLVTRSGEGVDGVLILGGDETVPHFRLPNPADDDDEVIASDNPYGTFEGGSIYLPEIPIGRLPDGDGGNLPLLLRQIDTLLELRRRRPVVDDGPRIVQAGRAALGALGIGFSTGLALGCSTAAWEGVTEQALCSLSVGTSIQISPSSRADALDASRLAGRRFLFFNLHGLRDCPAWYGQSSEPDSSGRWSVPPACSPDAISSVDLDAPIIFTTASFGAAVRGRSTSTSLALRLLSGGAAAVIGATATTYGAQEPPLQAADLLGQLFWANLRRGDRLGAALQRARQDYVHKVVSYQGYLDGDDQKTLLAFVLLGDPLAPAFNAGDDLGETVGLVPDGALFLCNQPAIGLRERSMAPPKMRMVIEQLADRCPEAAGGSVRLHRRSPCRGHCIHPGHHVAGNDGANGTWAAITARREMLTTDGHRLIKIARATVSDRGDLVKLVVSR